MERTSVIYNGLMRDGTLVTLAEDMKWPNPIPRFVRLCKCVTPWSA